MSYMHDKNWERVYGPKLLSEKMLHKQLFQCKCNWHVT